MENSEVIKSVNNAGGWLITHQDVLLGYAINIVAAIIIVTIGLILARIISGGLNRLMVSRGIDTTVADFLSAMLRYFIITFALIAALGRVGVQTASVIAVLGAAGLAVGLALQGSLANFAAGVLLVVFRPFRSGEFVDLGSVSGTVLSVHIFSTTLRTADGKVVVVPNGKIIAGDITNYSREPERRNEFILPVAHDADVEQVLTLLREVVEAEERVLKNREIVVALNGLDATSMNFIVRCWSNSGVLADVYWQLMKNFKLALDKNGVGIPYRQMEVNMRQTTPHAASESNNSVQQA